ncbi:hypothetical protein BDV29DRAFT_184262 [Aspergillus leporis]|uniref:Uncharacterized protein n=1 Tax=Aspergillus leporis TaxID=41062 RepID=A0A5N5WMV9_9EURO|nr:hypothetical protein BDV29DRAFT_184262 [Aspergillus leporis]
MLSKNWPFPATERSHLCRCCQWTHVQIHDVAVLYSVVVLFLQGPSVYLHREKRTEQRRGNETGQYRVSALYVFMAIPHRTTSACR